MIVLAIDTSGPNCAAAIYDANHEDSSKRLLAEISRPMERGHAEHLMQVIADALAAAGKRYGDIGRVVVTTGPGSFTGIRVGLAAARGIGLGRGIDVTGVTTLEAVHQGFAADCDRPVLVALDARRGEAWCQVFDENGEELTPPQVASHRQAADLAKHHEAAIVGSAIPHVLEHLGEGGDYLARAHTPPIAVVAAIGAAKPLEDKSPEPLYLREADAKPQTGFAVMRK